MAVPKVGNYGRLAAVPYPAPAPAATAVSGRTAEQLAATSNTPSLYEGNARQVFQTYQSDVNEIMTDFDGYLARKRKVATDANYAAADSMLQTLPAEQLAAAGPAVRDLYAEIDARSKGSLAAFREIAIQAGWARVDDSPLLQDEAAVRLMGATMSADLWQKVSKADVALDVGGLVVGMFEDDTELPASFTSDMLARFRDLPADRQVATLLLWREELVRARGNWFDIGVDSTPEARTNVLRVLNDLDKFMNPDATPVEAEKWIDRIASVLGVIDSTVLVARLGRLSAGKLSTFARTTANSARSAERRTAARRTPLTPDAPPPQAETTAGNAPRTAQEAQEGASVEGAATTLPGTETEAPAASQIASGGNPEVTLDTPAGPFTKDDYRNFGTGGDVRQGARDRAAVRTGEVQEGQRITRGALQQATETEEQNRLAAAARDARTPRMGEPVISEGRQLELDLARTSRVEPTISPRDPNEPLVTYGNRDEILRTPYVGPDLEGPVAGVRAGEPVISPVDPSDLATEAEVLAGKIGSTAASSKGFAQITGTSQSQVISQVIPGMEKLTDVSPQIAEEIVQNLAAADNAAVVSIKEEIFNSIRRLSAGDVGAYTATPREVKGAIARARTAYKKKLQGVLEAKHKSDVSIGMRRTKLEELGDYEYEATFDIIDLTSEDIKNPRILGQKTIRVTLGDEDIRYAGQSAALDRKFASWLRSPKSNLGMGAGRTVDLLVENMEIVNSQAEAYRKAFGSAVRKVFKGLSGAQRKNVAMAIMASQELGQGNLLPMSGQKLMHGIRTADGSVISLNRKEIQSYQNFYELTEANAYVVNALRTKALRANKVQRVNLPELGDVYVREIGNKFVLEQEAKVVTQRPRIWNKAGAKMQDGSVRPTIEWGTVNEPGVGGYLKNFHGQRHDYTVVKMNTPVQVQDEWFDLALVRKDEVLDIPEVVPHHPLTWIPKVPQHSRYRVVRETRGVLNGQDNQVVRARVIARAASQEEAELYRSTAGTGTRVEEDNVSRWTGDIDTSNSQVVPDDDYVDLIGIVQNLDPIEAVQRSVSILSRNIPIDSFRRLQKARWVQSAKKAGVIQSGSQYSNIVLGGKTPQQKRVIANLEKTKKYLDEALGVRTDQETAWGQAVTWIADNVMRKLGDTPAKITYSIADKDPVGWMQGFTFHTMLGMNPSQFIVQSSNVLVASTIGYKDAAQAAPLATILRMNAALNFGADAATAAARQEELIRVAVKSGYFSNPGEARAFFDAVRASGRIQDTTNSADISQNVADLNWMTRFKENAASFNLFFYDQGVQVERSYSMALSYLNYQRYLKEQGITRPANKFTRLDWAQVLTDQENLVLNMSKANKAFWQQNEVLRLPTQFMQVMAKFYETAFGTSRLISGEKSRAGHVARMMGAQFSFFGMRGILPIGAGSVATATYMMLFGKTPEEDAQEDPEGAKTRFAQVNNGVFNMASFALTGSELGISGRMSINQGFSEIMNDIMINDKSLLSLAGGASGNWLSTFANGRQEIMWPLMAAAGEFENPEAMLAGAAEGLDFMTGVNNLKNAYDMYANHKLRSRSGSTILEKDFSASDIAFQAAGFRLQDAIDVPEAIMDSRKQEERLTQRARQAAILLERAVETQSQVMLEAAGEQYADLNDAERQIVAEKVNYIVFQPDSKFIQAVKKLIETDLERTRAQQAVLQSNELENQRSRETQ